MSGPRFLGLSTGRAGSRYLTGILEDAGIDTLHEVHRDLSCWNGGGALGEVSAWVVNEAETTWPDAQIWHFSRHPQPFVTSLIKFGFWGMHVSSIHDHLRHVGDVVSDSFLYWVDWNRRILDIPETRRTTFRIEDISADLIAKLAGTISADANIVGLDPHWSEKQDFTPIPEGVRDEVYAMMEELGYAPGR